MKASLRIVFSLAEGVLSASLSLYAVADRLKYLSKSNRRTVEDCKVVLPLELIATNRDCFRTFITEEI